MESLLRIGVFYDGSYFYRASTYYKRYHERRTRISITGLHEFIRHEVAQVTKSELKACRIVDAHYFSGRHWADKSTDEQLYKERKFDEVLMGENVTVHYMPLYYDERNHKVYEKSVDVWLALEAFEMAIYKRFDMLVLIAGDGDFIPLVRKLNALGMPVMLVGWDFSYIDEHGMEHRTRMSARLIREVPHPVAVHEKIDSRIQITDSHFRIDNLFVPNHDDKESAYEEDIIDVEDGIEESDDENEKYVEEYDDTYDNSIASIVTHFDFSASTGQLYGFIRGESFGNDVYFSQDTLVNIDLGSIKQGMKVKYVAEIGFRGTPVATKVWAGE